LAVAFGGLPAHRLFMFPGVISAEPSANFQIPLQKPKRSPFHKGASAALVTVLTSSSLSREHLNFAVPRSPPERSAASGGEMLFKIAFVLLVAWLLGVLRVYPGGDLVHVFLLTGLMLLLLAFLKARDAAGRRAVGGDPDKP
jgi:hypothetical protein